MPFSIRPHCTYRQESEWTRHSPSSTQHDCNRETGGIGQIWLGIGAPLSTQSPLRNINNSAKLPLRKNS
jgi:hypothetical protein